MIEDDDTGEADYIFGFGSISEWQQKGVLCSLLLVSYRHLLGFHALIRSEHIYPRNLAN